MKRSKSDLLCMHMFVCDRCRTSMAPEELCDTGKQWLTPNIIKDFPMMARLLPDSACKIRENILRQDKAAGVT